MSKYHNEPVTVDGYRFDSKAEAARYQALRILEKAGYIADLRLQPQYLLQPAFTNHQGKRERAIIYRADFAYHERMETGLWLEVVEDVKGVTTKDFLIKWKIVQYQNPSVDFRLVKA